MGALGTWWWSISKSARTRWVMASFLGVPSYPVAATLSQSLVYRSACLPYSCQSLLVQDGETLCPGVT
jgi:hypothetical protein